MSEEVRSEGVRCEGGKDREGVGHYMGQGAFFFLSSGRDERERKIYASSQDYNMPRLVVSCLMGNFIFSNTPPYDASGSWDHAPQIKGVGPKYAGK